MTTFMLTIAIIAFPLLLAIASYKLWNWCTGRAVDAAAKDHVVDAIASASAGIQKEIEKMADQRWPMALVEGIIELASSQRKACMLIEEQMLDQRARWPSFQPHPANAALCHVCGRAQTFHGMDSNHCPPAEVAWPGFPPRIAQVNDVSDVIAEAFARVGLVANPVAAISPAIFDFEVVATLLVELFRASPGEAVVQVTSFIEGPVVKINVILNETEIQKNGFMKEAGIRNVKVTAATLGISVAHRKRVRNNVVIEEKFQLSLPGAR